MSGSVSMIDGHIDEVLKPCPFCGARVSDEDQPIGLGYVYEIDAYCVVCDRCGAEGGHHDGRVDAIEAWNRRADNG